MDPLLIAFRDEICKRAEELDSAREMDWTDMSIGFFLAKGATIEHACDLARLARYRHQYWQY